LPKIALLLFSVFVAVAAVGAHDADLWRTPDIREVDDAGNLRFAVIKDRNNYTLRTLQNGHWFTYYYQPRTEKLLRVVGPDATEQLLYNTNDEQDGTSVTINNLTLTVREERDGTVIVTGMPTITVDRDQQGRHTTYITGDGLRVAAFAFSPRGYLRRVSLADKYHLDLSQPANNTVTETLRGPDEKPIRQTAALGIANRSAHVTWIPLDAVAHVLGLGTDWENAIRVTRSASGIVMTLRNAAGTTIGYIVSYHGDRFGFDANGKALFYDLRPTLIDYTASGDADAVSTVMRELSGVAPTHIIVTRDGGVGAALDAASPGAFQSVWIEHDAKGDRLHYRTVDSPNPSSTMKLNGTGAPQREVANHKSLVPVANLFVPCGSSTVCVTCDFCGVDGGSGESCTKTTYLCDDGSSYGGGDTTSGSGSAWGSSTGPGGNQTSGTVSVAVAHALTKAQTKLQSPQCRALLSQFTDGVPNGVGGNTLAANLQNGPGGPWDPWQWMNYVDTYTNGYASGKCSGGTNAAYTSIGSVWIGGSYIYVCDTFSNLTPSVAANRLIHEFFHTIGLPEYPGVSGALTSAQINQMIDAACGTN